MYLAEDIVLAECLQEQAEIFVLQTLRLLLLVLHLLEVEFFNFAINKSPSFWHSFSVHHSEKALISSLLYHGKT